MNVTTNRTFAILNLAADQIRGEIAEYEALLVCLPRDSRNPNDAMARGIVDGLIRDRHATLDNLDNLKLVDAG